MSGRGDFLPRKLFFLDRIYWIFNTGKRSKKPGENEVCKWIWKGYN
jgi:hypothetical protein